MAGALQCLGSCSSTAQPGPELIYYFLPKDLKLRNSICSTCPCRHRECGITWKLGNVLPIFLQLLAAPFSTRPGDCLDLVPSFGSGFMALRVFLCLMWKDAFWVSVFLNKPLGFVLGLFLPIMAVLAIILELIELASG